VIILRSIGVEFSLGMCIEEGSWLTRDSHHWGLMLLVHLWCTWYDSRSTRKFLVVLWSFLCDSKALLCSLCIL